jgi:hypothetical protein
VVVALGLLLFGLAAVGYADTHTVMNTNDSGTGSLRQAIADASDGDAIDFNSPGVISLLSTLVINKSLTISSQGGEIIIADMSVKNTFNVIEITGSTASCKLTNLDIGWGLAGIYVHGMGAVVDIENCNVGVVSNNSTPNVTGILLDTVSMGTVGKAGNGNVIAFNTGDGIRVLNSTGITIQGNTIGLDFMKTVAQPNAGNGITLINSNNIVIGGDYNNDEGNLIAGNTGANVYLQNSHFNTILGNSVGCNGSTVFTQGRGMVLENSNSNHVGQKESSSSSRNYNLIGGNTIGIDILPTTASGASRLNYVQNNFIGCTPNGVKIGNGTGIHMDKAYDNKIGGSFGSETNHIEGSTQNGINLVSGTGNSIAGNYIGVQVPNGFQSIQTAGAHNFIGGNGSGPDFCDGNYFGTGLLWLASGSDYTVVQGNKFGMNTTGQISTNAALDIESSHCLIGGLLDTDRNYFCGVLILSQGGYNSALNNWFNILPDGSVPPVPMMYAIEITNGATYNLIGDQTTTTGNLIANCKLGGFGIIIDGSSTLHNSLFGNTICAFSNIGIGLTNGGNGSKAAPVVTTAGPGTIEGTCQANDIIEIFESDRGAGVSGGSLRHIGYCPSATTGSGHWTYTATLSGGTYICAIATDTNGNSSPFSLNVAFNGPVYTSTPTLVPTATPTPTSDPNAPIATRTPNITSTPTIQVTAYDMHGRTVIAYPNPNPGKDSIKFLIRLDQPGNVKIAIYNLVGEQVALLESVQPAGQSLMEWKCQGAGAGVYVAQITQNGKNAAAIKLAIARK